MFRHALLLLLSLACLVPEASAQSSAAKYELKGRVVEMRDGKREPIAGIKVRGADINYAFTDQHGSFTLRLPSDLSEITLTLEETTLKLIAPSGGRVALPCPEDFLVQVCGEENRRLNAKVAEMESQLMRWKQKHNLSQKRLAELQKSMTEQILQNEQTIQKQIEELKSQGENIERMKLHIAELELQLALKEVEIAELVLDKFLAQQAAQKEIAAELENYLIQLKDLRDWLGNFEPYFHDIRGRHEAASDFFAALKSYEAAWAFINQHHANHLTNIRKFWGNPDLEAQVEAAFNFILDDIHQRAYLGTLEQQLRQPLLAYAKKPSAKNREAALNGAASAYQTFSTLASQVESHIESTNQLLTELIE